MMHHGSSSTAFTTRQAVPLARTIFPRSALEQHPDMGRPASRRLLITACRLRSAIPERAMAEADPSSFSCPDSFRTHHLYLRCRVDFESRSLRGTAALTVRAERDNLRCLVTLSWRGMRGASGLLAERAAGDSLPQEAPARGWPRSAGGRAWGGEAGASERAGKSRAPHKSGWSCSGRAGLACVLAQVFGKGFSASLFQVGEALLT